MKIVLATFGSLGDVHPMIALGIELKRRGHKIVFAAMEFYREKIDTLGFEFRPLRPNVNPEDRELARTIMNAKDGTERLILDVLMPNLMPMYEDLSEAVKGADVLISGEVVYAAASVVEKTKIRWITTSLAPASFLSAYDPFVPPPAPWMENVRFLGANFHKALYFMLRRSIRHWYTPYKEFRRKLDLSENHDPIFDGKYSKLLHLAMFSKILGKPQPDWHSPTLQTGFCFYDGQDDLGEMPDELNKFLDAGEPPIVFTLGSAAALDAGNFFEESAKAARVLGRRAVLLYGVFNEPPKVTESGKWKVLSEDGKKTDASGIVAFEYAPYSQIFPRAACVVHQGGVGTTAQVLRAGVPHLIMPYAHDQPDNAARCARIGVARIVSREKYRAETAAKQLSELLGNLSYKANAIEAKRVVSVENGVRIACDAIVDVLK